MSAGQDKSSHQSYDAYLGLGRDPQGYQAAYALVKFSYAFDMSGILQLAQPLPLQNSFMDENNSPCLKQGCDYWPFRLKSDIALQGKAYARDGKPVSQMNVSISVGSYQKQAIVFGSRIVSYGANKPLCFHAPETFETMELTYENAYGGLDWRVPIEEPLTVDIKLRLQSDHPGLYPRNPFGKGYAVVEDSEGIDGLELPNIENPHDLLTPSRFFVGNPRNWHLQPLPWCFDWQRGNMFPRCAFFGGADGWYPAPENSVKEVTMGLLPKNYRSDLRKEFHEKQQIDSRFFSEAAIGLSVPFLKGNEPVVLQGFHPQGTISFQLPGSPKIELLIEGKSFTPIPILHSVLLLPEDMQLCLLWAVMARTSRRYIPGIHKTIPIEARVNQDKPFPFQTPVPIEQALQKISGAK